MDIALAALTGALVSGVASAVVARRGGEFVVIRALRRLAEGSEERYVDDWDRQTAADDRSDNGSPTLVR